MKSKPQFRPVLKDQLSDYVTAIAWSSDTCFFAISAQGELVQWQLQQQHWNRQALVPQSSSEATSDARGTLSALAISADGHWLAVCGQSGRLEIWNISHNPPKLAQTHLYDINWLDKLTWHPSQPLLAVGVGRTVELWSDTPPEPFKTLEFQSSSVLSLDWHPQDKVLAVGGHGGVKIWDLETSDAPELLAVPGASVCTQWSLNGEFIASGNLDRTLSVMHYKQPPPWLMQGFPNKVSALAWSQRANAENYLAAAASDGITIWTQKAGLSWESQVLTGHQGLIRDLAFQPNGQLLASGGNDRKVRLWKNGRMLQPSLNGSIEGTHCLSWNPTGTNLGIGGIDGTVLIFELSYANKGFG